MGRRPKTIYEVSLVKSFCGGQERFLLSYFLSKRRYFRAGSCIHVATALLLGRAERSTPEARRGHAVWRAGIDGERARRATIGHRANDF
jgi:hypothetical protein